MVMKLRHGLYNPELNLYEYAITLLKTLSLFLYEKRE